MNRAERLEWYKKEFKEINNNIKGSSCLSLYDFLRIRNYKLQNISTAKERDVRKITREAFKLAERDQVVDAIEKLRQLNGVGIPVASAILAMRYPKQFAIIDRRVLQGLKEKEWLKDYQKNPKVYKSYLIRIRQEAKKKKMELREYELYLFQKGNNK